MATALVADRFDISQRRVQQLAKEYRDSGEIPELETPRGKPYGEYPDDLEQRVIGRFFDRYDRLDEIRLPTACPKLNPCEGVWD